ncbi:MAG TPA: hypothetical protein VFU15_14795 [Bacteroidia bacterium]|nr:hypothetical protein [Bacteroidia bacterium]
MNRRLLIWVALFLACCVNAHAQWDDTLRQIFHGSVYPSASFDTRNSFVSSRRAHVWGLKIGVAFSDRIELGIGHNFLDDHIYKNVYYTSADGSMRMTEADLRLWYSGVYAKYVYYTNRNWRFSIMPVQIGFGSSRYIYSDGRSELFRDKRMIAVYEPGISVSYKIVRWVGVGADLGWRYMLRDNPYIIENFNSPTYAFYVIVYWGEIYKDAFPNTRLAKML